VRAGGDRGRVAPVEADGGAVDLLQPIQRRRRGIRAQRAGEQVLDHDHTARSDRARPAWPVEPPRLDQVAEQQPCISQVKGLARDRRGGVRADKARGDPGPLGGLAGQAVGIGLPRRMVGLGRAIGAAASLKVALAVEARRAGH
jgi:hypothetical protein